jgi:hypothetical protein
MPNETTPWAESDVIPMFPTLVWRFELQPQLCHAISARVTSDANMVATIRSLNSDSYLYFGWNTNGQCTFVEIENDSTTAPKR